MQYVLLEIVLLNACYGTYSYMHSADGQQTVQQGHIKSDASPPQSAHMSTLLDIAKSQVSSETSPYKRLCSKPTPTVCNYERINEETEFHKGTN